MWMINIIINQSSNNVLSLLTFFQFLNVYLTNMLMPILTETAKNVFRTGALMWAWLWCNIFAKGRGWSDILWASVDCAMKELKEDVLCLSGNRILGIQLVDFSSSVLFLVPYWLHYFLAQLSAPWGISPECNFVSVALAFSLFLFRYVRSGIL